MYDGFLQLVTLVPCDVIVVFRRN